MIHMHWQIFKSNNQDGKLFLPGRHMFSFTFSIRGKEKKVKRKKGSYGIFSFFFCAKASELSPSPVPSRLHCYYLHHHHHYEFVCCFNARGGGKRKEKLSFVSCCCSRRRRSVPKKRGADYLLSPKRIYRKKKLKKPAFFYKKTFCTLLVIFFRGKLQLAMSLPASSKCSLGWKFRKLRFPLPPPFFPLPRQFHIISNEQHRPPAAAVG